MAVKVLLSSLAYLTRCEYFKKSCHLVKQVDYVWDSNGKRTCDHVMQSQNINHDFPRLMEMLGMTEDHVAATAKHDKLAQEALELATVSHHQATVVDRHTISAEARAQVESVYFDDMCAFGFNFASEEE